MIIKRSFHPVGQGAFYTEQIGDINIVYDCGSVTKKEKIVDNITTVFTKNDVINYLFISHFDEDHVRYIIDLIASCKEIKNVVLPLLHQNKKDILISIYNHEKEVENDKDKISSIELVTKFIEDPTGFFNSETKFIYAENSSDNDTEQIIDDINSLGKSTTISSNTYLSTGSSDFSWYLRPYNHNYEEREEQLLEELSKKYGKHFNVKTLIKDIQRIVTDRKELNKVYKKVKAGINHNSLLLLSVPICYHCQKKKGERLVSCHLTKDIRMGCLYTGDSSFNLPNSNKSIEIWKIFEEHWDKIGTIQIPHHGSIKEWNKEFLKYGSFNCVVSSRSTSKMHPNCKVVDDIIVSKSKLHRSNENQGYYQEYEWIYQKEPIKIK